MQHRLLHEIEGKRTFVVVLATGEEAMQTMQNFVEGQGIGAAQVTGIGAFSEVTLNYFDWPSKQYKEIPVREQVEVACLLGDVAIAPSGKPSLHIHLVIGKCDGSAMAGHLGAGTVRPTLELIVEESPAHLQKVKDSTTGLSLIQRESKL
jgi:predicted DNA-binding protein with PD1-like motif